MIYFTSDLHFFFKKFSRVGTRVFDSFEEKNEFLVTQWNSVVSEKDEVYILGDVSNGGGAETAEIIRQLNGKKYLVHGNNDHYLDDPDDRHVDDDLVAAEIAAGEKRAQI